MSNKKEKTSESSQWAWSSEYTFVSPYTMDECIAHLNNLNAKYQKDRLSFWKTSRLKFEKLVDNGGIIQFEIKGSMSKTLFETVSIGQVVYKDHDKVLIRIRIGIIRQSALIGLITLGITSLITALIFALAYQSIAILIALILFMVFMDAIILLGNYEAFSKIRYDIYTSVYEALSIAPAPRPTTLPL